MSDLEKLMQSGAQSGDSVQADASLANMRVEVIYRLLLEGWTNPQVVANAQKTWGIQKSQAYEYIKRARERLSEEAAEYRATAFAEHLAVRRKLRRDALTREDGRLVLEIMRDEAKLLGLYPPDKIAPTTPDGSEPYQIPTHAHFEPGTAELAHRLLGQLVGARAAPRRIVDAEAAEHPLED